MLSLSAGLFSGCLVLKSSWQMKRIVSSLIQDQEMQRVWGFHATTLLYFISIYTCVQYEVIVSQEWVFLNDDHEGSGKSFVGYGKMFCDKTATALKSLLLLLIQAIWYC